MKIDIAGRHITVTEGMQEHIHEKVQKMEKHFDGFNSIHVTLSIEGGSHMAEMVLPAKRAKHGQLVGKAKDVDDMYAAIDAAAEKLTRQITRFKERLKDHRHEKPSEHVAAVDDGDDEPFDESDGEFDDIAEEMGEDLEES